MCSRESCSVVPSRFFAGLLILLGAFLVGLFAVASLTAVPILGTFERAVNSSRQSDGCSNSDHVAVQVAELRTPQLQITNDGNDPIYFFPYDLWVRGQGSPFEYPAAPDRQSQAFEEIKISAGETLSAPLKTAVLAEAIFRYRVGEARSFRSFTTHFSDGCR